MYRRIVQIKDDKHFGTETTIYKSEENFLVIVDGRDGRECYFVDLEINNLYPVNLYTSNIKTEETEIDCIFDINWRKYGFSKCPDWVRSLLGRTRDGLREP